MRAVGPYPYLTRNGATVGDKVGTHTVQRLLVMFAGIPGYKKLWVTFDPPSQSGEITGQIHRKTEDVLLGYSQLATEGRMFAFRGGMNARIRDVTRDGHFTIETPRSS